MLRPHGRKVIPAALVAATVVIAAIGLADAGAAPRTVKIPASLAFQNGPYGTGCVARAFIKFPARTGGRSYTVNYVDNGVPQTRQAPPFDPDAEAGIPWGNHAAGLTGIFGSESNGCVGSIPGWKDRFKDVSATVLIDPADATITGHVTGQDPKSPQPQGLAGVPVSAIADPRSSTRNGAAFGAKTGPGGIYSISIPKDKLGLYTVSADLSRTKYSDASARVYVNSGEQVTVDLAVESSSFLDPGAVSSTVEIKQLKRDKPPKAEFFRNGQWTPLAVGTPLRRGDVVRTDDNTAVALELDLGGRVSVRPGSEIEIVDERSVKGTSARQFKIKQGGVWAKCGQMKESIEIQTTGGIMGIGHG